jgi:hypothetical protein
MRHLLIVAAALVGFAATSQATLHRCPVIGFIENVDGSTTPVFSINCGPVVIGGDFREVNYWTYFPTREQAEAKCDHPGNVVYDYGYKAYRCRPLNNSDSNN